MTDPEALEQARKIVGRVRVLGSVVYIDDGAEEKHKKLDALLLDLLAGEYPELVTYIRKLRLWYG